MTFLSARGPHVFAHRGGCALGPENTIAAFDCGRAAGADGLELDVQLSADGVVVVCHDPTLDRTTGASGPVRTRTAADLARVDAGFHFVDASGGFPLRERGIGVPALRDVLERYRDMLLIVEMKENTVAMGRAVAEAVRHAGAVERVCAAGYGQVALDAARAALPEMATSASLAEARVAVYRSLARWPVRKAAYEAFQVPETAGRVRIVSPRFIRHVHEAGRRLQVWTIDEEADMRRLLGWGVDGLISNRPDVAVRVRDAYVRERRPSGGPL
jgi:glycerophosphoryl diester phosphodiesterase